jgi:UDP-N-acetylglucosamine 1-carboxyvinyltransferase
MQKILVKGGRPLSGLVSVSGSKNAALPVMTAALLGDGATTLDNIPNLQDIRTMAKVLETLGAKVKHDNHQLVIDPSGFDQDEAPYDLVKTMRASIYSLGACLARLGKAKVSLPGGCAIGARPIDLHLKGVEALGAKIRIEHGYVIAEAPRLKGAHIHLAGPHGPSLGATINVLLAATAAEGKTVLESASVEPEVEDTVRFLLRMGADIQGCGTSTLTIHGGKPLKAVRYSVIPDRVEAGTFLAAAAITRGEITVQGLNLEHLSSVLEILGRIGVEFEEEGDALKVRGGHSYRSVDIQVSPYPGFPTDMQAQMTALLSVVPGLSVVTETIWENRFMHVLELNRMGADIKVDGNHALVRGVPRLTGAPVMASDLRASAALVLAGLVADGETLVQRIYHLDRGYERIEAKLSALGAEIRRVD